MFKYFGSNSMLILFITYIKKRYVHVRLWESGVTFFFLKISHKKGFVHAYYVLVDHLHDEKGRMKNT